MRAAIVSLLIAALCSSGALAQPTQPEAGAKVDALFAPFNSTTPGCAVGVGKDGSAVFSKGYGMADLEHGVPITPRTMFNMASVSKQFTALTVLMLAKENKLALNDSVRKYVPELPPYADKITIYHLLTHTSGLRDYLTLGELAGLPANETAYSDDIVLRMLLRQQGLNFAPGTRNLYSNSGYVLLAIIVGRVAGKPLNEVARAQIFGPLGMSDTLFQPDHTGLIKNQAFGYDLRKGAWHAFNSRLDLVGDGGVYSSVDDMFHWMGNFDAPKVGADALSAMETPARLAGGKTVGYGMGLTLSAYRGLKVVEHFGALAGYRAEDMWFPAEKLSVVVLCNTNLVNPAQLARKISDLYLKEALQPAPALAYEPEVAVDPKLLDAYVGDYELSPGSIVSIIREKDHLLSRTTGQSATPMYAVSDTAFRLRTAPAEVDFDAATGGGSAQSAVLHQEGALVPMKRVAIPRPSAEQLKAYQGRFYSPELDVAYYVLDRAEGALEVLYPGGEITLEPVGADTFAGPRIGVVKFVCARGHACSGLSIDDGRALNLRFVRVAKRKAGAKSGG